MPSRPAGGLRDGCFPRWVLGFAFEWAACLGLLRKWLEGRTAVPALGCSSWYKDVLCGYLKDFGVAAARPAVWHVPGRSCVFEVSVFKSDASREGCRTWFTGGSKGGVSCICM